MKTHEELKKEFAEKWSQFGMQEGLKKALEKDILFDLNVLFDKLMPTEEDFNKAVKANLPFLIKSTKGKLQYPYISGHAHAEIEKQLGHELWEWFRKRNVAD